MSFIDKLIKVANFVPELLVLLGAILLSVAALGLFLKWRGVSLGVRSPRDRWIAGLAAFVLFMIAVLLRCGSDAPESMDLPSDLIASFPDHSPVTDNACAFHVYNDNNWHGHSQTRFETLKRGDADDYYLRIAFDLDPGIPEPHCGVYADFSFPPYKVVDFTPYKGIRFLCRSSLDDPGSRVEYLIVLAALGVPNYEYHECSFTASAAERDFVQVEVDFEDFKSPTRSTASQLDLARIFRIGFTVKSDGAGAMGTLDIDQLELLRK